MKVGDKATLINMAGPNFTGRIKYLEYCPENGTVSTVFMEWPGTKLQTAHLPDEIVIVSSLQPDNPNYTFKQRKH